MFLRQKFSSLTGVIILVRELLLFLQESILLSEFFYRGHYELKASSSAHHCSAVNHQEFSFDATSFPFKQSSFVNFSFAYFAQKTHQAI